MSLTRRGSSMDQYEEWNRDRSSSMGSRRKLSFNPVGQWVPPAAHEEPLGAFEVSKAKRIGKSVC